MYTLLNGYLMVYTKAGFIIFLVHRHLDFKIQMVSEPLPFQAQFHWLTLIWKAAPGNLSPCSGWLSLFLSQLGQEGPAHPQKLTQACLQSFQHNSSHPHSTIRYVFLDYYARDGPRSPTGQTPGYVF